MLSAMIVLADLGQIPSPPFKRSETAVIFQNSSEPRWCIAGNIFISTDRQNIAAFDLTNLKPGWKVIAKKNEQFVSVAISNGVAYGVSMGDGKSPGRMVALNARTGKSLWQLSRIGRETAVAADSKAIYLSIAPNSVSRIDLATHRAVWSAKTPKASLDAFGGVESLVATSGGVLGNFGSTTFCLDPSNGKTRWIEPKSYVFNQPFAVDRGVAWIPSGEGSLGREIVSGKVLWNSDRSYGDGGFAMPGRFVGISEGSLNCLDSKTGKEVWSVPLGPKDTSGGNQSTAYLSNTIFAVGIDNAVVLRPDGSKLWHGKADESIPEPVWTNGTAIVSFDGTRLIRYVHGEVTPLPTTLAARRAMAEKMVKDYDKLDDADKRRLIELKTDAFEPLLQLFLATCHAHDAQGDEGDSFPLYSKYHDVGDLLMKVTDAAETDRLIAALTKEKKESSAKPVLLTLLAQFGDPVKVTPYF